MANGISNFVSNKSPNKMNKITTSTLKTIAIIALVFTSATVAASTPTSKLWINITNQNGIAGQTAISYMPQGTTGIDYGYDAQQIAESNVLSIYSRVNNINLCIQARPLFVATDIVTMGYTAPTAGTYNIYVDHCNGVFMQGQKVFLKDKETGTINAIGVGINYTFTSQAGRFNERFEIIYQEPTALATEAPAITDNKPVVYKNNSALNINTPNTNIVTVCVYDTNGRRVFAERGINSPEYSIDSLTPSNNVLIVEVLTTEGRFTKKVVY